MFSINGCVKLLFRVITKTISEESVVFRQDNENINKLTARFDNE
jgi:hypothetical protein